MEQHTEEDVCALADRQALLDECAVAAAHRHTERKHVVLSRRTHSARHGGLEAEDLAHNVVEQRQAVERLTGVRGATRKG